MKKLVCISYYENDKKINKILPDRMFMAKLKLPYEKAKKYIKNYDEHDLDSFGDKYNWYIGDRESDVDSKKDENEIYQELWDDFHYNTYFKDYCFKKDLCNRMNDSYTDEYILKYICLIFGYDYLEYLMDNGLEINNIKLEINDYTNKEKCTFHIIDTNNIHYIINRDYKLEMLGHENEIKIDLQNKEFVFNKSNLFYNLDYFGIVYASCFGQWMVKDLNPILEVLNKVLDKNDIKIKDISKFFVMTEEVNLKSHKWTKIKFSEISFNTYFSNKELSLSKTTFNRFVRIRSMCCDHTPINYLEFLLNEVAATKMGSDMGSNRDNRSYCVKEFCNRNPNSEITKFIKKQALIIYRLTRKTLLDFLKANEGKKNKIIDGLEPDRTLTINKIITTQILKKDKEKVTKCHHLYNSTQFLLAWFIEFMIKREIKIYGEIKNDYGITLNNLTNLLVEI